MNRLYKTILFFALVLIANPVISNSKDSLYNAKLYQSFQSGDMRVWLDILKDLELDYKKKPSSQILLKIVEVQYGYIGYLLGIKKTKQAREILVKAEENVEKILESQSTNADAIAFKSALTAYYISLSPYKAPFLGPRSMSLIDQALAINSESIQANIEKGNTLHYAPSMFGGDPLKAVTYYTKAKDLFEKSNQGNPPQNWLYLNTLVQIALAYSKANSIENARKTFKGILTIAPDFKWVNEELYPKFLKSNR